MSLAVKRKGFSVSPLYSFEMFLSFSTCFVKGVNQQVVFSLYIHMQGYVYVLSLIKILALCTVSDKYIKYLKRQGVPICFVRISG